MSNDSKIRMVLSNWTYRDFNAFARSFQGNDTAESYRLAQKLIGSWDYEADLNDPEAFLDLPMEVSTNIVYTVLQTVQKYHENMEAEDVKVDMHWNTRRFLEFDKARTDGNTSRVETMLREVCELPEGISDPMTFEQGSRMMSAFMDKYKRLMQGKN